MENIQAIGLVAAYMVIEASKFFFNKASKNFDQNDKAKLQDLWAWNVKRQPQEIHHQTERMIEILMKFEHVQQLQLDILNKISDKLVDRCPVFHKDQRPLDGNIRSL